MDFCGTMFHSAVLLDYKNHISPRIFLSEFIYCLIETRVTSFNHNSILMAQNEFASTAQRSGLGCTRLKADTIPLDQSST